MAGKGWKRSVEIAWIAMGLFLWSLKGTQGVRFVIDREECLSHDAKYEGDTLHVSFVVIKADSPWHFSDEGIDLVIRGPSGEQIHDFRDKTSEKYEFVVQQKGVYSFCFYNKSPYHETIDFDVKLAHFAYQEQHAKDEHIAPLLEQISKLEEALYNIQFEQHWIEAQTDRQAIVNDSMGRRAIHKAMLESAALVGASILQVRLPSMDEKVALFLGQICSTIAGVVFTTDRAYQPGEQVFISYGKKSNGELLLSYGFAPKEGTNPSDSVELPLSLKKSDKCYKEKLEALRKHGLSASQCYPIQITGWPLELTAYAYLAMAAAASNKSITKKDLRYPEIEEKARQFILDSCESSISKYSKFLQASGSIDLDVTSPKQLNRRVFMKQLAVDLCTRESMIIFAKSIGIVDLNLAEVRAVKEAMMIFAVSRSNDGHKLVIESDSKIIDFDVKLAHFANQEQHAKDEHIAPLLEQISKLEEALYNIQFEQHWIEAQTDRQAIVNDSMGRRAIHKAMLESAALIGASTLQVYLLRRLFERKLGTSRV
ncbi:hypothetical protein SCA6_014072 [Theobroma cacao]